MEPDDAELVEFGMTRAEWDGWQKALPGISIVQAADLRSVYIRLSNKDIEALAG